MSDNQLDIVKERKQKHSALMRISEADLNIAEFESAHCTLCQYEHRDEIEQIYEETGSIKRAHHELKARGIKLDYSNVSRHIKNHYIPRKKRERIRDYGLTLYTIIDEQRDRREQLIERIAINTDLMYDLASQAESLSLDDKLKTSAEIKKLSEAITAMEDRVALIDDKMSPAEMLLDKLYQLMKDKMKGASEDVKKVLYDILEELELSTQNMSEENG